MKRFIKWLTPQHRGKPRARPAHRGSLLLVKQFGLFSALIIALAAPSADAAIVLEEVVTGTGSSTSISLPAIQGGSSQTYVVFIETENNEDVTGVSGGGLTWTEQKEQCGAANVAGSRVWSAQGSPGGSFQVQITKLQTKKLTAVLVRYSGVGGIEGAAGENKNGPDDTSCGGGETQTAQLTLTSTQANSVHLVGVGMKAKTVNSVTAGYTLVGSNIQNTSKAYLYARSFAIGTTDQLQAGLTGGDSWATAGLVLAPAAALAVSKRAFWPDGAPIPTGATIPSGVEFKYLLYINNQGIAASDVSVRDVLDAAFQYQVGTLQVDNSVAACAAAVCTAAEEQTIFAAVQAVANATDAVDGDVASYTGASLSVDAGNSNVGNAQLDISGNAVWAMLFSVKMP